MPRAKASRPRLRAPGFTPAEARAFNALTPKRPAPELIHAMDAVLHRYSIRCPVKGCRRAIKKWCRHCGMARCARHAVQANKFDDCAVAGDNARWRIKP